MTDKPVVRYGWKQLSNGRITVSIEHRKTLEELFDRSSFGLPVRDVTSRGYVAIRVKKCDKTGDWLEDVTADTDWLWQTICEAATS